MTHHLLWMNEWIQTCLNAQGRITASRYLGTLKREVDNEVYSSNSLNVLNMFFGNFDNRRFSLILILINNQQDSSKGIWWQINIIMRLGPDAPQL